MRQMNMSILRVTSRLLIVLMLMLVLGCPGRRITKGNVDEVAEGMSKKQVESILGIPTEIDNKDFGRYSEDGFDLFLRHALGHFIYVSLGDAAPGTAEHEHEHEHDQEA